MDVQAYNSELTPPRAISLGAVALGVWASGFRRSQERTIQVSKPINATAPNLFDRLTLLENFQFAAAQSFSQLGDALANMGTWPGQVPTLAHLSFTQGNQTVWLGNAGINKIELHEKSGNLVTWAYTIVGGTWSANKPF